MITATAFGKITKEITYDQITYNNSSTPVQTARVTISCYNVSAPKDAEYKTMFITVNVKGWNAEYLRKNNVGKEISYLRLAHWASGPVKMGM